MGQVHPVIAPMVIVHNQLLLQIAAMLCIIILLFFDDCVRNSELNFGTRRYIIFLRGDL